MLKFWEFFVFLPPALITRLYFWCFNPLFLWIIQSFLVYCSTLLQEKKNCGWDFEAAWGRQPTPAIWNQPDPYGKRMHCFLTCLRWWSSSGKQKIFFNKPLLLCLCSCGGARRGGRHAVTTAVIIPFPAGYRLARVTWALRDACGRRRHVKSLCWGVSSLAQTMHLSCAFRQGLYLWMPNDSQGIIYQIGEMNHLYSASELLSADRCQSSSQESEWQPCNGRRAPDRQ